jgi:UDP-galactopyranose mutase
MHMAIGSALTMFDNRIAPYFTEGTPLSAGQDGSDPATASTPRPTTAR